MVAADLSMARTPSALAKEEDAEALWERLQRAAFAFVWEQADPRTGLVRNTTEPHAPASITAMGVSLSGIPIAIERGWISRAAGYQRALRTLKTMARRLEHVHGFSYHFLDPKTGRRTWHSEISCIDTAIAIAGALVAGQYFAGTEVERLAQAVYERVDWPWLLNDEDTLSWGWKPETGVEGGSIHFSEGILAYLLALGSPTHPIPPEAWHAMRRPVSRYAGQAVVFVHDGSDFILGEKIARRIANNA
jgi:hypothetical protein